MTRHETPFVTDGDLIIVEASVTGPRGAENGYVVRVAAFSTLGFTLPGFGIQVFDLGHDDIDGLLGMNLLSDFNFEIRPAERRILVEKLAP